MVLTGAGISTESGIPDYRGPAGAYARGHQPMTYQAFRDDPQARHRYWARSHLGWPHMAAVAPNAGHIAVARLETDGLVDAVITQNVDGLHSLAGSQRVIDLHGRLSRVVCLSCGDVRSRASVHERLVAVNPEWTTSRSTVNPDGDVDLPADGASAFTMVTCECCGGPLKPDVVYFGERVPPDRVQDATALVAKARLLLVLGSSLHVYSGRRFVVQAARNGTPIGIINQGETRCDELAATRIDAPLGLVLDAVRRRVAAVDASR